MLNIQVKRAETPIIKGYYTFSVEYFLLNIFRFKALKYAYFGAYVPDPLFIQHILSILFNIICRLKSCTPNTIGKLILILNQSFFKKIILR
jgi:hypothetical protein